MSALPPEAESVLGYWLGPDVPADAVPSTTTLWFRGGEAVDEHIRKTFLPLIEAAGKGELDAWQSTPRGSLALLLLLDQFTRNAYRGTAKAFGFDPKARAIAREALARGDDKTLSPILRTFFYLPFEHEESMDAQRLALEKFTAARDEATGEARKFLDMGIDYARKHLEIIERFGRFPHRNAIVGRESTPEEIEFLKQPDSSF